MKRFCYFLFSFIFLCGCSAKNDYIERVLSLRQRLLQAESCCFDAVITADYGDRLYTFAFKCQVNQQGDLDFNVVAPESISGITGTITEENGSLTFDDQAVAFATMVDGQIVPVCAPWIFIRSLRSGYINACSKGDGGFELIVDDSYQENALQLNINMDMSNRPTSADILWKGRRILSLEVNNFSIL